MAKVFGCSRAGIIALSVLLAFTCMAGQLLAQASTPAPQASTSTPQASPPAGQDKAVGSPDLNSSTLYSKSFKILFALFIIATILESGLAVIFNWRPFVILFDARGFKTLVSLVFSYFFVYYFDFDAITSLMNEYGANRKSSWEGMFITALVISGGSSGVNKLLVAMGFRPVLSADNMAKPMPPETESWISVRLVRKDAVGAVAVLIGKDDGSDPSMVSSITGFSIGCGLLRYFLNDPGRFPPSGGYALQPGVKYRITLTGEDKGKKPLTASWGPQSLAPGAMVDLDMTL